MGAGVVVLEGMKSPSVPITTIAMKATNETNFLIVQRLLNIGIYSQFIYQKKPTKIQEKQESPLITTFSLFEYFSEVAANY